MLSVPSVWRMALLTPASRVLAEQSPSILGGFGGKKFVIFEGFGS
jgi:hypothetical protein